MKKKKDILNRKIFLNKNNNQYSLTLPRKDIEELIKKKKAKTIKFRILELK